MIYGYIRVSSKDQNTERQKIALKENQVEDKNIFTDKQSGKDFKRPAYKKLLRKIKEGDLIVVKSIDRLGRNYGEILEQWRFITQEKKVDIQVLDMPLLDTRSREDNLTGLFISDLVLQILAYVAQTEREFIKQRQKEGIAAAKANGKKFGRSMLKMPDQFLDIKKMWEKGEITSREAAKQLGVSHTTFYRRCKAYVES